MNIPKINFKALGNPQNITNISITEEPETIDNRITATKETIAGRDFDLGDNINGAIASISQDTNNSDNRRETDLNSLFEKYDTDEGNKCLLDTLKQEILWWTYSNGTLQTSMNRYCE